MVGLDLFGRGIMGYPEHAIGIGTGAQQHLADIEPGRLQHLCGRFVGSRGRLCEALGCAGGQFDDLADIVGQRALPQ